MVPTKMFLSNAEKTKNKDILNDATNHLNEQIYIMLIITLIFISTRNIFEILYPDTLLTDVQRTLKTWQKDKCC